MTNKIYQNRCEWSRKKADSINYKHQDQNGIAL
jgi:hypothetical protein